MKEEKKPVPGVEDAELVIQIPVGLPCLERGRLVKKVFFVFGGLLQCMGGPPKVFTITGVG